MTNIVRLPAQRLLFLAILENVFNFDAFLSRPSWQAIRTREIFFIGQSRCRLLGHFSLSTCPVHAFALSLATSQAVFENTVL
jgi:hypothetical protein